MTPNRTPNRPARRRAAVAVLVAACLTVIVGFVAIAVDGGMLFLELRRARATADAAAMAAATELYEHYPAYHGTDTDSHDARRAALRIARRNGFPNSGDTTASVSIPPATGAYSGQAGYAEVTVTKQVQRTFALIWGSEPIPVSARAVSRGAWVEPKAGVLILDYDDRASLSTQGNGAFTETGGSIIVNSNNPSALVSTGNGTIRGQEFYITGGVSVSGGASLESVPVAGQIFTGTHPTPDPLAYLPVPSIPSDGTMTQTDLGSGNKRYTLSPGRYTNLPQFNMGDEVILRQASAGNDGVYYIDGGGFKSTGALITMDSGTTGGVMLYNVATSTNDKIQVTGNPDGRVDLSPLTEGPYQGLLFWQQRTSDIPIEVSGNGDFSLRGTLYAAGALLSVTGNGGTIVGSGGATGSRIGSQYVSKNLSLAGNGNIFINYTGPEVAKTRIIALVE